MYDNVKKELYFAHINLEKYGLVMYTSGNISVKTGEHIIIKPSGIPYDELKPEDFVVIDLNGKVIEGKMKPSVDTATHLYIYRNKADIGCIIHTHSPYASAFAILEEPLPVYSTAHADVFGIEIPVTEYAPVGSDAIGKAALKIANQSRAVLLAKHGVLVFGKDLKSTLREAIFLEEVAKTAYFARTLGEPRPLDKDEAQRLYKFHHTHYGQR